MASFAAVGDRQEDLVLKEALRSGITEGDGGKTINDIYTSVGLGKVPESKAVNGKPPKQPKGKAGGGASVDPASERDGKACVAALANKKASPSRVTSLGLLDNEAAYAVAVNNGLYRALTSTMHDDALEVELRWILDGNIFCYLHHITTTVFRGERHRTDGGFGSVDAERFSAYLKAEPAGWYALCGNATNVASMLFNPNMDPELWAHAHRCTRDVWTFFNLALTHRAVAVALFRLDPSGGRAFSPGNSVRMTGLNARPELNGKLGKIAGAQGARLQVELDDGTQVALKPTNLQPETASLPPATTVADLDALLEDAVRLGAMTEAQIDRWTDTLAEKLETEHGLMFEIAPYVADAAVAARDASAGRNASACICVATAVIIFRATMQKCWAAEERAGPVSARDPGSVIEANAFQAAAMLQYWATELGVGVDVLDLLQLDSSKRAMFRNFSSPMAVATIEKGGTLTQEESMAVMMAAGGLPGKGGGGGKGGKGKGNGDARRRGGRGGR